MTLFSGRIIIFIVAIASLLGFATGMLHINPDHTRCLGGKAWSSDRWFTLFSVSKLELRYRNYNWDCQPGQKYDSDQYKPYP